MNPLEKNTRADWFIAPLLHHSIAETGFSLFLPYGTVARGTLQDCKTRSLIDEAGT